MARQVVIDTETTGLSADDRIVEIGCVELVNRRQTGRTLQHHLNPGRPSTRRALEIHGLTPQFLEGMPRFSKIERDLLDFVMGAELLTHNAPFDMRMLDHELSLTSSRHQSLREVCQVQDTLRLAKRLHPGEKNSLAALCDRYGVSRAERTLHGALKDAKLLASVYLAMTS